MSPRRRERLRKMLLVAVAVSAAAVGLGAYALHLLRQPELNTVDARFSIRGERPPPRDVVVVPIDDVTFSDLGVQWPFPRSLHARAIDRLHRAGARAIAYDVQFTEATKPAEDNALIDAVARARPVVLATTEVDAHGRTAIFGGDDVLRGIGARPANALVPADPGGVIRRLPYAVNRLKSISIVTAEVAEGHAIPRSALGRGRPWIDYRGPPGTVRSVSFSHVLRGQFPNGEFRGKIVVVGPAAPSLQDVHPTSTSGHGLMSGAEIQANAIATALAGFPLRSSPTWLNVLLIVVLAVVAPLLCVFLVALRWVLVAIALGIAYTVAVQLAFEGGSVLPFLYPLVAVALSVVGTVAVAYVTTALERERVRDIFSRFVPEAVVGEVLARTDERLRLGGVKITGTVLFSDLRGFTTFSESLQAEQVIDILNRYLAEMSAAILDHGGTLVAYLGDGIMAIFGAPIESEDHADRALATAREMLEVRLPRFNEWLRNEVGREGFDMGVGLNSGPIMSGNVGSERRLEYTAIGDTVNTASRLEGMTKGTGRQLFVAESTRAMLRGPYDLVYVDELAVRGRRAAVKVWSLVNAELDSSAKDAPRRIIRTASG